MTDKEYKLAPSVPTKGMISDGCLVLHRGVVKTYTAMTKDAPTVQEVDLRDMIQEPRYDAGHSEVRETHAYNQAIFDIQQKHGKIYAIKGK
jgi:hypothetical protein